MSIAQERAFGRDISSKNKGQQESVDESDYRDFTLGWEDYKAFEQDAWNAGNSFTTADRPELPLLDPFLIAQGEKTRHPLS
jgi:hypothetical protein